MVTSYFFGLLGAVYAVYTALFCLFSLFFCIQVHDRDGMYDKMGLQLKALRTRALRRCLYACVCMHMLVYALISITSYYFLVFISADDARSSASGASASRNAEDGVLLNALNKLNDKIATLDKKVTALSVDVNALKTGSNSPPVKLNKKVQALSADGNVLKTGSNSPPVKLCYEQMCRISRYRRIPHYQPRHE